MSETPDMVKPNTDLIIKGVQYGLIAGLGLSVTYALLGLVVVDLINASFPFFLFLLIFGFPLIFIRAIGPATIYGIFTGLILGAMIDSLRMLIPKYTYVVLSAMVCLGIAILSHYILGIRPVWSFESMPGFGGPSYMSLEPFDSYLFWIGFPTIVYIVTGGCVGWRLHSEMLKKTQ